MLRLIPVVLLCALAASSASALRIEDAYPRYMEAALFKTVTEYLTGEPSEGRRLVARTQPGERRGAYFILTLDRGVRELPEGTEARLELIPSNAREPISYRLPLEPEGARTHQLYLGVTGSDWPSSELQPVAWRVRVQDGETVLAEWQSFLWEMP